MLNYCTQAIEDMERLLESSGVRELPGSCEPTRQIIHLLRQSVKFEMPENGIIIDTAKTAEMIEADLLNLPFPNVALQYPFTDFSQMRPGNVEVRRRIALCLDYNVHKDSIFGNLAKRVYPKVEETGGILVLPIYLFDTFWAPSIWGVLMPKTSDTSDLSIIRYGKDMAPQETKVGMVAIPVLLEGAQAMVDSVGVTQAKTTALQDAMEEVVVLLSALVALSCVNVVLKDTLPPDKLNKKRAKTGKVPLYGYKELVVSQQRTTYTTGSAGEERGQSQRQSPREHLRRGHVRMLGPKKRVWVSPTMVAGRGHLDKTYKLT